MSLDPMLADYISPSYGGVKLRYCGTLHLPSASSEALFEQFLVHHPRKAMQGICVLVPHSPESYPPLKAGSGPVQESCLDVWVACEEDNVPVGPRSSQRKIPTISLSHIEKWRIQTNALRRDDLVSDLRPQLPQPSTSSPSKGF